MPDRPPFPIPDELTPETFCLCLQIPNDPIWKTVIAGLLWMPGEWFNWQRDEASSGATLAHYWRTLYNEIDWSTMSCCCGTVLAIQFEADGTMLVTYDGTNYVPAVDTGQDPRYTSPQLPPLPDTGVPVDNRCRSATNAVQAMKDAVDTFGADLGTAGTILALAGVIALAVVGVFAVPPSATVLVPIVIGLAQAIFSIASGTYLALFTGAVYDDLQCIFFNNCSGDDGTFTQSDYLEILSDIDGFGFDVNVALTFTSVLRGWVLPGLNAASRGGSLDTGDCSDCEDCAGCSTLDWEIIFSASDDHGEINEATRTCDNLEMNSTNVGGDGRYYVQVQSTSDFDTCEVVDLDIAANPFDLLIAWNLSGETRGTFTHSGAIVDVVGQSINCLMVRSIDASNIVLTT